MVTMSECDKPLCTKPPTETYVGQHGNSVKVCASCYFTLVTRQSISNSTTSTDIFDHSTGSGPIRFDRNDDVISDPDNWPLDWGDDR